MGLSEDLQVEFKEVLSDFVSEKTKKYLSKLVMMDGRIARTCRLLERVRDDAGKKRARPSCAPDISRVQ